MRVAAPKIVIISPEVPGSSDSSAGADYLARHLEVLQTFCDVRLVVPATEGNKKAAKSRRYVAITHFVESPQGRVCARASKAFVAVLGLRVDLTFSRRLLGTSAVMDQLSSADAIEFQWTPSAAVVGRLRRAGVRAPTVLVVHDVYRQLWKRRSATGVGALRRVYFRCRQLRDTISERRIAASVDLVSVFSKKDADLLGASVSAKSSVEIILPPFVVDAAPVQTKLINQGDEVVALFTGAFGDLKNADSARWLIQEVLPKVEEPNLRVVFGGAQPPQWLTDAAGEDQRIVVTGFVPDLNDLYATADLFLAPLRTGSGVKFKVVTAMLSGLPVIATSIGAEGIGRESMYWAIADDSESFAGAITSCVADLREATARATDAQAELAIAYSTSTHEKRVREVYSRLIGVRS